MCGVVDQQPFLTVFFFVANNAQQVSVGGIARVSAGCKLTCFDANRGHDGVTRRDCMLDCIDLVIIDIGLISKLACIGNVECPVTKDLLAPVAHAPGYVGNIVDLLAVVEHHHGKGSCRANAASDLGHVHLSSVRHVKLFVGVRGCGQIAVLLVTSKRDVVNDGRDFAGLLDIDSVFDNALALLFERKNINAYRSVFVFVGFAARRFGNCAPFAPGIPGCKAAVVKLDGYGYFNRAACRGRVPGSKHVLEAAAHVNLVGNKIALGCAFVQHQTVILKMYGMKFTFEFIGAEHDGLVIQLYFVFVIIRIIDDCIK